MERVVVAGLGVISAIGDTTEKFRASLFAGASGIRPLSRVDPALFRFKCGAEVPGYDSRNYMDDRGAELMDPFAQFAVIAARAASADAAIEWTPRLQERTAVITGSCIGGQSSQDASFYDLYHAGRPNVHPLTIPRAMANAGACHITMEFGITGPSYTISTACSSSAYAIGQAFWMVRSGAADMAVTGGSEAPFSVGILKAWDGLRVVSDDTCRPFSKHRRGMILGEGAAMLVLERRSAALARGAHIWAEIVGFGMSSDASHITRPSPEGAAQAMRRALADANISSDAIGYINAHGTGTIANDAMESKAIRMVFEGHTDRLAVSSTKSMHGHALGAASAIEAAATVIALRDGILPPTMNYLEPDPECALDVVPNHSRATQVEYAMSNSFAFGGMNAVLVFAAER